jgi:DNA polymerase II small subunit/DNA polymerase delta subunit B
MGIIVAFATQEASAIYINNITKEKLMSENSETKNVDEPTIKFADDGKEHKINEMPDNAKELMVRWQEKKQIRDDFIIKANNDIDDLNTLLGSYEARMKNILEPIEEKKIEVTK